MVRIPHLRSVALVVFVAGLLAASWFLPVGDWVEAFTRWVEQQGAFGVLWFAGGYVLGTVLFVPGSIMSIAAGIVFGMVWGPIIALVSATIGASIAFLIARYLARGPVERWASRNRAFAAIDKAVGAKDWKVIGLTRLSPLIPFNVGNYFFGVTKARFWAYVAASFVGMAPGDFLYAYLGHVGAATLGHRGKPSTPEIVFLVVGLVATVAVTWYVARVARKQLHGRKHAK